MSDLATALKTQFTEWGSNATQADDAALVLADKCVMTGGKICLIESGEPLTLDYVKQRKPHLLSGTMFADRTLADRAFIDGNITCRGTLLKTMSRADVDKLAQQYGLKDALDTRRGTPLVMDDAGKPADKQKPSKNPWSAENWSLKKQAELARINPKGAAEIAAAAGSFVGATSPKSKRLISRAV